MSGNIFRKIKSPKKTKFIVVIIACSIAALMIGYGSYLWFNVSKMYEPLTADSNISADVDENENEAIEGESPLPEISLEDEVTIVPVEKPTGKVDILLLGVDNRNNGFSGRTDTMIFMRIDLSDGKIKMVSLMRDTLVKMDGHPKNRLNTAFRFGSYKLLKSTLEDNFGLSPDYYVVVNFYGMENIIDALNGIELSVNSSEKTDMNKSIKELNKIDKDKKTPFIEKTGLQNLNGRQALAYMRVRHAGNDGDAGRIERQQTVLSALFDKAKQVNLEQIPGLINTIAQYVRTDIPISEMLKIANAVKSLNVDKLETYRFPNKYYCGSYKDIPSVVIPRNKKNELDKLKKFLDG